MSTESLQQLLAPLLPTVYDPDVLRITAQAGHVSIDTLSAGSRAPAVEWTAMQHAAACRALATPQRLDADHLAHCRDHSLIIQAWPRHLATLQDVCAAHLLSPLAADLLAAALAIGRNVLLVGPWQRAVPLAVALGNGGARPAIVCRTPQPAPASFLQVQRVGDLPSWRPDLTLAWDVSTRSLVRACVRGCGVVAHIDAYRIDRALMRYELAAAKLSTSADAPLHVLAGVDLVVLLQARGTPWVAEVAEVVLAAEGYRPKLLFVAGREPAPTALQPVAPPSFVDELAHAGFLALADDLRHVQPPAASPAPPEPAFEEDEPLPPPRRPERSVAPRRFGHESQNIEPSANFAGTADSSPGWELDIGPAAAQEPSPAGITNSEEAAMAALHGLAPPPRPKGLTPASADRGPHDDVTRSFTMPDRNDETP